jgi:N-acetylglutamate synthase-like GNAT family acetyltransferase
MTGQDTIRIIPFSPSYQPQVDSLLESIVPEYSQPFYNPNGKKMKDLYQLPGRYYWIALQEQRVAGTAGIVIESQYAILKSVFVAKAYRGAQLQVAYKLVQTATEKAIEHNCRILYLGTMAQFTAAQRFYQKQGYTRIAPGEVPADMLLNEFDTVFYKKELY